MPAPFEVKAALEWNRTTFQVTPGKWRFRATGTWYDAVIPCSADGYAAPLFYATNVLPRIRDDGRYFRLMGRIVAGADPQPPAQDDPAATFVIGTDSGVLTLATAGTLFVFANDHKGMYWNNWGSVFLTAESVG